MGEQSLTLAREIGDRATLAFALLASGYAANERGDVPATRMLLGESISLFQEIHEAQMMAVASTVLGVLELRESEYHRAAQHFRSALTTHHQNGNRWMVIYGIINVGRTLAATRQAAVAARLLGAAQGLGTGLGDVLAPIGAESARKLLETLKFQLNATDLETMLAEGRSLSQVDAVTLAVEALDRLQRNPDRSKIAARTNDGVERLTRREREVAALLARGLSDREIADELFITPGTVGVHVHNILAKLHVTSRRHVSGKLEERASPSSHLPD